MDRNEAASVIQRFLTCRDIRSDDCCGHCETCRYNTEYDEKTEALQLAIKALDGKDTNVPTKEIIRCKDCDWWTKQEASLQGRCALSGTYPTGAWFCANARKRGEAE